MTSIVSSDANLTCRKMPTCILDTSSGILYVKGMCCPLVARTKNLRTTRIAPVEYRRPQKRRGLESKKEVYNFSLGHPYIQFYSVFPLISSLCFSYPRFCCPSPPYLHLYSSDGDDSGGCGENVRRPCAFFANQQPERHHVLLRHVSARTSCKSEPRHAFLLSREIGNPSKTKGTVFCCWYFLASDCRKEGGLRVGSSLREG